jgi:hypothetical protein
MATLQVLGSYGMTISIVFDEIVRDYRDGTTDTVLVGHTNGVLEYALKLDFLPDAELTVTDPEDSNIVKTWQDYFWDFFVRRKQDGAAFDITDPRTGSTVSVKFVDSRLDYEFVTYALFSAAGIRLRQHRVAV